MAQVDSTARRPMTIQKPTGARRPLNLQNCSDGDLVKAICDALGEHNPKARRLLLRMLKVLGRPRVAQLLKEARQIERDGGLFTNDGTRRRTPAGVFFKIVKMRVTDDERRRLWPPRQEAPDGATNGNTRGSRTRDSEAD